MAKRSGVKNDGAPMSPVLRLALISYQLAIGFLLIYGLVRLSALEFPEMAVSIEARMPFCAGTSCRKRPVSSSHSLPC